MSSLRVADNKKFTAMLKVWTFQRKKTDENSVTREIDSDLEAQLGEFAELADKEKISAGITNGLKDTPTGQKADI